MTDTIRKQLLRAAFGGGFLTLLIASGAQADDTRAAYVMSVIADQAHGERMLSGDYLQAIDFINSPGEKRHGFAASNNLCVAYTKTHELEKAGQACANALRLSRKVAGAWHYPYGVRGDHALALSNRGVIRAITGDAEGARSDFEQAIKLNDDLTAAAGNLAWLEKQKTQTVSSL